MVGLLDEDLKTSVLKMLRGLKEDVEKVKKTMYEQNGNLSFWVLFLQLFYG